MVPPSKKLKSVDHLFPEVSGRNEIWKYFAMVPGKKIFVVCNLCHCELKYNKSLYKMKSHLKIKHRGKSIGRSLPCYHNKQKMVEICAITPIEQYGLTLDKWMDVSRRKWLLTITLNILSDSELNTSYNITVPWEDAIAFVNSLFLENCVAVVINFTPTDPMRGFFFDRKIPIIPCLLSIIHTAVQECFQIAEVNEVVEAAMDILHEHKIPYPEVNQNFWITQWNILNAFCYETEDQTPEFDAMQNLILDSAKEIVEMLRPLQMVVRKISKEKIPSMGMSKTLITDVLSDHLKMNSFDDSVISIGELMQPVLINHLENYLSENKFLIFAQFFDLRYSSLLTKNEESSVILGICGKTNSFQITTEIEQYLQEPPLAENECPLVWWYEQQCTYPELKKQAERHICVPIGIRVHEHIIGVSPPTKEHIYSMKIENMIKFENIE